MDTEDFEQQLGVLQEELRNLHQAKQNDIDRCQRQCDLLAEQLEDRQKILDERLRSQAQAEQDKASLQAAATKARDEAELTRTELTEFKATIKLLNSAWADNDQLVATNEDLVVKVQKQIMQLAQAEQDMAALQAAATKARDETELMRSELTESKATIELLSSAWTDNELLLVRNDRLEKIVASGHRNQSHLDELQAKVLDLQTQVAILSPYKEMIVGNDDYSGLIGLMCV